MTQSKVKAIEKKIAEAVKNASERKNPNYTVENYLLAEIIMELKKLKGWVKEK